MARRANDQPPFIPNGYCAGCRKDRDLYRVSDSRYRCADCYEVETRVRPWAAPAAAEKG